MNPESSRSKEADLTIPEAPAKNKQEASDVFNVDEQLAQLSKDLTRMEEESQKRADDLEAEKAHKEIEQAHNSADDKKVEVLDGNEKPAIESETVLASAEETAIEKKENPIIVLNNLIEEKRNVEREISKQGLTGENKEKKTGIMRKIIEKGCEFLSRNPEEQEERRQALQEDEWRNAMVAFGFKNEQSYEDRQKQIFIIKELDGRYNDLIGRKDNGLSEKQKKALLDPKNGEINAGGLFGTFFGGLPIGKEDVAIAIDMGVDISRIRRAGFLSKEILFGNEKFDDVNQFNEFIAKKRAEFVANEVFQKVQEKKREVLNGDEVSQVIMEKQIQEIKNEIIAKQEREKEARREQKNQERIEEAEQLSEEEKTDYLKSLKGKWEKAKKINQFLKAGKYKCKTEDGRVLNDEEGKTEMENKKASISDEIIDIAGKISGRDLRQEANSATGYEPKFGDKEKQKLFRKWLTKEVQKIFKEQVDMLFKKTKKPAIAKTSAEVVSPKKEAEPDDDFLIF